MKAVVTVVGKDSVGILANTSAACAEKNANIRDVTQSILDDYFCLIMIVDIDEITCSMEELRSTIKSHCKGMEAHVMHEDIFNSMHMI